MAKVPWKELALLMIVWSFDVSCQPAGVCGELLKRWMPCSASTTEDGECYRHGSQQILVSLLTSSVILNCDGQALPQADIVRCIPFAKAALKLYIKECVFKSFDMKDLVSDTRISNLHLKYTASSGANITFNNLSKLRSVTIEGVRTASPVAVKFHSLPNLFSISITNCNFTTFQQEPFKTLPNLEELRLRKAFLTFVSETLFRGLSNLRILDLQSNSITTIEPNAFGDLKRLREIRLTNNKITAIPRKAFSPLLSLQEVDLSFNPLTDLPYPNPFGPSKLLSVVKATNCRLKQLPIINWTHPSLTSLDFSSNEIEMANLVVFADNDAVVTLTNNTMKIIAIDMRHWHKKSPTYHVGDNQLVCNCSLEKFLQFLHSDIQKSRKVIADAKLLRCSTPASTYLVDVWPQNIVCPITDCPTYCNCSQNREKYIEVDCSGKRMKNLPSVIPFGTVMVNLEENCITSLSNIDAYSWQKVSTLYLSKNSLESLEDGVIPPNIKILDLSDNRLTNIPSSVRETVSLTEDYGILLRNNGWKCQCDSADFFDWFTKNVHKVLDAHQTFCTESRSGEKVLILDLKQHVLCPEMLSAPVVAMLLFAVALSVVSLLAASYYFRSSLYSITYYIVFKLCPHCVVKRTDKVFDVLMIYHETDHAYANKAIQHQQKFNNKVCIQEYTSESNDSTGTLASASNNSCKTLILATKELLECRKFKEDFFLEIITYMEKRAYKFVIVAIDSVSDMRNLECGYYIFLLCGAVLKWNEAWFWTKLHYFLRPVQEDSKRMESSSSALLFREQLM